MPALLVHYTSAYFLAKELPFTSFDALALGAQGPDTFMAYGTVPWHSRKDKKTINPWGAIMHHTPVEDVYVKMMSYALEQEEKDVLFDYIEGAFLHFALDRLMHPYIFARTGFDENGELHGFFKWSHGFFEAILDKDFARRCGTFKKPWKVLKIDEKELAAISKMWAACVTYPLEEDSFVKAQIDYVSAMKMIYSPTGIKRPLLKLILGKYSAGYAQSMPASTKKYRVMDVQNLSRSQWRDPCTNKPSNASVDDLFKQGLEDFKQLHEIIKKAKNGEDVYALVKQWAGNLDHDGTPYGAKKKRYSLCWDALK